MQKFLLQSVVGCSIGSQNTGAVRFLPQWLTTTHDGTWPQAQAANVSGKRQGGGAKPVGRVADGGNVHRATVEEGGCVLS